jgi:dsRNA-specific ribonuclease
MDIENPPPDYKTNETINAEALEALFGAIYLNRGFEETKRIAEKYILINLGLIK